MDKRVYYNENDPRAAAWLRGLMADGLIPVGTVDERSIAEVQPADLDGYTQCHFFAGIGGWPLALDLAEWGDAPVWTGSCPCQPFSTAGKRKGTDDSRHLWPQFYRLISACKPPVVLGEQVASKDGRDWLAGVRSDLEALGYEVGAADLCAASLGAPHIRQRLWWVADTGRLDSPGRGDAGDVAGAARAPEGAEEKRERLRDAAGDGGAVRGLADGDGERSRERCGAVAAPAQLGTARRGRGMGDAHCGRHDWWAQEAGQRASAQRAGGRGCGVAYSPSDRFFGRTSPAALQGQRAERAGEHEGPCAERELPRGLEGLRGDSRGPWAGALVVACADGKARRIVSRARVLADGLPPEMAGPGMAIGEGQEEEAAHPLTAHFPNRAVALRGLGNAIVPPVAAEFVGAYMEARDARAAQ